jgi:flagellin
MNSTADKIIDSSQKLSTGKRINKAGDDSASLSIATKINTELKAISKAQDNALDALNTINFTYDGLNFALENLQKMREIKVKASNGTNSADERGAMQLEFNEYVKTIQGLRKEESWAPTTISNDIPAFGRSLFSGIFSENYQVGSNDGDFINLDFSDFNDVDNHVDIATDLNMPGSMNAGASVRLMRYSLGSGVGSANGQFFVPNGSLSDLDTMIDNVSRMVSVANKYQARFQAVFDKLESDRLSLTDSKSHFEDTDIAKESSVLVREQIRQQGAVAMNTQANAQ